MNNNNEKLLKYLLSFYDNSELINNIKKNINDNINISNISFLDLTNSTEKHLFLYFELIKRDCDIFKNNISIFRDDILGIVFFINGESTLTLKNINLINNNNQEFIFFCRELINQFYNIKNTCLYCLDEDVLDFFNCKNCNALVCGDCFKTEYILNGDVIIPHYKKCMICRARKGYSRTATNKTYKEILEDIEELILKKRELILKN
jgi:hypothetical protein